MAGTSLNDVVTDYALSNSGDTYNFGKNLLQETYSFSQIMAAGSGDYNSGLLSLAGTDPIPSVLADDSVLWLDAARSTQVQGASVENLGTGGSTLDAEFGSTSGADTNDPLLLAHTGDNYVYMPGSSSSDYLTVAGFTVNDAASFTVEVDCDIMDAWESGGFENLIGQFGNAGSNRWALYKNGVNLVFFVSPDGSATPAAVVAHGLTGTGRHVISVVYNGAAETAEFFVDGVSLGAQSFDGSATTTYTGGTPALRIFSTPSGGATQLPTGKVYSASAGGFTFNAATDITDAGATSFTATSGQTVSVNRSTSGRKTTLVTRPVWLLALDDFFLVPHSSLVTFDQGDDFSLMAVARLWSAVATNDTYMAKVVGSNGAGYFLNTNIVPSPKLSLEQGSGAQVAASGPASSFGDLHSVVSVVDWTDLSSTTYLDGTAGTAGDLTGFGVGLANDTGPLHIGSNDGNGNFMDMELLAVAIWDRTLTTGEIAEINTFYGTV